MSGKIRSKMDSVVDYPFGNMIPKMYIKIKVGTFRCILSPPLTSIFLVALLITA